MVEAQQRAMEMKQMWSESDSEEKTCNPRQN
jgi:hypothetical protein